MDTPGWGGWREDRSLDEPDSSAREPPTMPTLGSGILGRPERMTHTPRPWKAEGLVVLGADGADIAAAWDWGEEGISNARLIAAAPDLLAALKGLLPEAPCTGS